MNLRDILLENRLTNDVSTKKIYTDFNIEIEKLYSSYQKKTALECNNIKKSLFKSLVTNSKEYTDYDVKLIIKLLKIKDIRCKNMNKFMNYLPLSFIKKVAEINKDVNFRLDFLHKYSNSKNNLSNSFEINLSENIHKIDIDKFIEDIKDIEINPRLDIRKESTWKEYNEYKNHIPIFVTVPCFTIESKYDLDRYMNKMYKESSLSIVNGKYTYKDAIDKIVVVYKNLDKFNTKSKKSLSKSIESLNHDLEYIIEDSKKNISKYYKDKTELINEFNKQTEILIRNITIVYMFILKKAFYTNLFITDAINEMYENIVKQEKIGGEKTIYV